MFLLEIVLTTLHKKLVNWDKVDSGDLLSIALTVQGKVTPVVMEIQAIFNVVRGLIALLVDLLVVLLRSEPSAMMCPHQMDLVLMEKL